MVLHELYLDATLDDPKLQQRLEEWILRYKWFR
jgi:hypothetical protein